MRFFSASILIASVFALSGKFLYLMIYIYHTFVLTNIYHNTANAASFEKRAISAPVALCITDLASVSEQLSVVKTAVSYNNTHLKCLYIYLSSLSFLFSFF